MENLGDKEPLGFLNKSIRRKKLKKISNERKQKNMLTCLQPLVTGRLQLEKSRLILVFNFLGKQESLKLVFIVNKTNLTENLRCLQINFFFSFGSKQNYPHSAKFRSKVFYEKYQNYEK